MAFFITGDTHGDFTRILKFINKMELKEGDTILILGDCGLFWRNDGKDAAAFIKEYEANYTCTIAFLAGNHENFKKLSQIPIVDGIGEVSPHIKYLLSGSAYNIDGKVCLIVGGADSVDKFRRTKGLNWWKEEQITNEFTEDLISKCNGAHFDYVFTHAAPRSIFEQHKVELCTLQLDEDTIDHTSEDNLQKIMNVITFDNWRFGHYHQDLDLDEKFSILYNGFEEVI